jgi:hypothetical protein
LKSADRRKETIFRWRDSWECCISSPDVDERLGSSVELSNTSHYNAA